jgi:hypothetical protein
MVLIHWILFLPYLWEFLSEKYYPSVHSPSFSGAYPTFWESFIMPILAMDMPAILITVLIWSPYYFIDMPDVFENGAIATSFFTITIQWLIIGKWFSQIIDRRNQKIIENSIFDAN